MKNLILLFSILILSGCGSMKTVDYNTSNTLRFDKSSKLSYCKSLPSIYSGVSYDICNSVLRKPGQVDDNMMSLLYLFDLPLSVVVDTVLLPYTVVRQFTEGNIKVP